MSTQTTLTEDAPMILDATCSFARIWPRYASLRMDVRPEVKPDIVADARFLPFRPGVFDRIYCDPPHMIRKDYTWEEANDMMERRRRSGRISPGDFTRYGHFPTHNDWMEFVESTDREFARTLKPEGRLHYKITETKSGDKRTSRPNDLSRMTHFEVEKDILPRLLYVPSVHLFFPLRFISWRIATSQSVRT